MGLRLLCVEEEQHMMDLFQIITDRIVDELERGTIPWQKPWSGAQGAISHTTGRRYSLLNQMLLGCRSGEFITFKEAQREGGHIRKGEKASMIVFWKFLESAKKDDQGTLICDADGKPVMEQVPFLRYYNVFHIDQCEGIRPRFAEETTPGAHLSPDEAAESIVRDYIHRSGVRLTIRYSDRAFYSPAADCVTVPELAQYTSTAEYYSTLFHELTHSTGHSSRLNRIGGSEGFGSEAYSREELVAELGAAYLVQHAGLETTESFRNSAGYIQSWLKALRDDKRLIVSAAGRADKAVAMILNTNDAVKEA